MSGAVLLQRGSRRHTQPCPLVWFSTQANLTHLTQFPRKCRWEGCTWKCSAQEVCSLARFLRIQIMPQLRCPLLCLSSLLGLQMVQELLYADGALLRLLAFAHSMRTHYVGLQRSRPCPATWDFRLSLSLGIMCARPTLMATTGQAADSASAATAPCQGVHGNLVLRALKLLMASFCIWFSSFWSFWFCNSHFRLASSWEPKIPGHDSRAGESRGQA